ncbi:UDP-Glycosyltransferase/glycogen phosphorylase [Ascobolus immersus RN42]|uniref:Alpha-1,3/1,6-mannosyltransferase ALG2 n=1 Tax=Ascobolus immersus RN42 TaxID=1160509 RepID=A0A3N4IKM2_ASCIM|nr:UDP-Glycosyltransferase/glycogen phosphorylase [Ascobolus immersus RN42]
MASSSEKTPPKPSVLFIHPDLGIGGAERLVVDAAVGLQDLGHPVTIYTSHCDPLHCFEEARNGTLKVRVAGNTIIPPVILGRFAILCAILRQLHLTFTLILSKEINQHEYVFCDQLPACIPLLRLFSSAKILFYCHFPDRLLAERKSLIKKLYRLPFDAFEKWTMNFAHGIVVNSKFTRSVYLREFGDNGNIPRVVYPCVDVNVESTKLDETNGWENLGGGRKVVLSINRFERKKDIELAVLAFARLEPEKRKQARLIIAGGYDTRVKENVEYHQELQRICDKHGLLHASSKNFITALSLPDNLDVIFLLSIPSALKSYLLNTAQLLVYTPSNEHFGIVPLEAGLHKVPVLATASGGPLESIEDERTGFLRKRDVNHWASVMDTVLFDMSDEERKRMGEKAKRRVTERFSKEKMAEDIEEELERLPSGSVWSAGKTIIVLGLLGLTLAVGLYSGVSTLSKDW